jgi:hypothetical protein
LFIQLDIYLKLLFEVKKTVMDSTIAVLITTMAVTSILSSLSLSQQAFAQNNVTQEAASSANQTGEKAQSSMNQTGEKGQSILNQTGEGAQSVMNQAGEALQNINPFK